MEGKYKVVSLGKMSGGSLAAEERELSKIDGEVELVEARCTTEDELIATAGDADAIIGGGRLFTRRVLESLPKCQAIVTYSVGFDTIDLDAATENGIIIVNNPSPNWCVEEVSNHAIALLLICAKKITQQHDLVKQGRWADAKQGLPSMVPIRGQTLGLIGFGDIGRMTARKGQCFGLKPLCCDPYVDKSVAEEYGADMVSMSAVLKEADFVSVHTLLNEETRHLIGEGEFKQMKPTAYFINTARGPVVDEAALIKALEENWIAGAGLDVFEKEPVDLANPLLKMDNVAVIPHSASYSDMALREQPVNPAQEVARVLSGRWPRNPVNKSVKPKTGLVEE